MTGRGLSIYDEGNKTRKEIATTNFFPGFGVVYGIYWKQNTASAIPLLPYVFILSKIEAYANSKKSNDKEKQSGPAAFSCSKHCS